MSANASLGQIRREVLDSPLRFFARYRLALDCCTPGCLGGRTVDLGAMARRSPRRTTVLDSARRLRCIACGRPPDEVHFKNGPTISQRVRMKLLGMGGKRWAADHVAHNSEHPDPCW